MSEQLTVTLGLNSKSFSQAIKTVNSELKYLDKEFAATAKGSDNFASTLDGQKAKVENLTKKYEAQSTKLSLYKNKISETKKAMAEKKEAMDKLTSSEEKNEAAIAKTQKQIDTMASNLKKLENEANLTQIEMDNLTGEIDDLNKSIENADILAYSEKMQQLSKGLTNAGDQLQSMGQSLSAAGAKLTMGLTVPIVGLGTAAVSTAATFEKSMSNVEALSGATGEELASLEEAAKEMGRETTKSASDAADALGYMALAGWDTQQMLTGLEPILRLSEAANTDLAYTSDLVTDSMSALGVATDDLNHYLDIVAKTQASANTSADGMLEAYIGAGGTLKNLNVTLEESAAWIGVLANRGIKSSEAGTSLNSVLVNLMGTSGQASEALELLGVTAWDSEGNFKGIEQTLKELDVALNNCTEEQANLFTAMIGGKTQMDTLNAMISGLNEEYSELKEQISDCDGALYDMAATMQDNAAGNFATLKSKLEALAIQIGDKLLPHVNKLVDKAIELIDWFGGLSDETQSLILKTAAFAAAAGPVLTVLGKTTSAAGSLVKVAGKLTGAMGASGLAGAAGASAGGLATAATSLGSLAVAAAPWIAAGAAVVGTGYAIKEVMTEEVVPSVDLFADKVETATVGYGEYAQTVVTNTQTISEATQMAVQSYLDMDEGVTYALNDMYINSEAITCQTAAALTTQYEQMGQTLISQLDKDKKAELEILNEYFAISSELTAEEEADIIQKTNDAYTAKQTTIEETTAEIQRILAAAAFQNRELTEDERDTIAELQEQMKTNAINILSENEAEAALILDRMKDYDKRITAEQASEHIKALNESRDKAVQAANDEYDERYKTICKMRDDLGSISEETAEDLIADAKKQRDGIVQEAEDTRLTALEEMRGLYDDLDEEVDTRTGEILTKWDKVKRWWSDWQPETKTFSITESIRSVVSGLRSGDGASPQAASYGLESASELRDVSFAMPSSYDTMMVSGSYFDSASPQAQTVVSGGVNNSSSSDSAMLKLLASIDNKLSQQSGGITLAIDTFNNSREMDIKSLVEEIEFYRRQASMKGVY